MRSLPARAWPIVLAAAVLGGRQAALRAQPTPATPARAPVRPVIAPGAEVPGAAAAGAADVATAQKLARAGKVTEAVALLEKVAAAHPSVVHDCNLSLAYLRAGRLTEAQLEWDASQYRKAPRPDWCGESLSTQLASALRDDQYVPLSVQAKPADAVIDIVQADTTVARFRGLALVWLPAGTYSVVGHAGEREHRVAALVALPSASVAVDVSEPVVVPAAEPDAGVTSAPPPDARVDEPPIDAAATPLPELPPTTSPRAKWPAYVGAGVGLAGVGVGALFHVKALHTKERANDLVAGSAGFQSERDRFGTQRAIAIAGYGVGAAALGFAAVWWLTGHDEQRAPTVGVTVGDGGASVSIGGALP